MSVSKLLINVLREYIAHNTDVVENTVSAQEDAVEASLHFADCDRYSVTMRSLNVGGGTAPNGDVRGYLSATAAELARRLTFLEEPLAVWELDSDERAVQLRSSPPQREDNEITYWEVVLQVTKQPSATLTRYRWTPDMIEREVVAYPATFALITRMTDSLNAGLYQAAE